MLKSASYQTPQVAVDLRDGGIGLRSLDTLTPLAHLACWASAGSHVEETMPTSAGWHMRNLGQKGRDPEVSENTGQGAAARPTTAGHGVYVYMSDFANRLFITNPVQPY